MRSNFFLAVFRLVCAHDRVFYPKRVLVKGLTQFNLTQLTAGVILVHDLANRKSQQKLRPWLLEVLLRDRGNPGGRDPLVDNFDGEQFGAFEKAYQANKVKSLIIFLIRPKRNYQLLSARVSENIKT